MRTLFKFMILILGGLLVLSGCASAEVTPETRVERMADPSPTPQQMTESEVEDIQAEAETATTDTDGYIFYDSYADW